MGNAHHEQHENVVSLVSCHDGKEKIGGFAQKIILGRKQHFWAQKGHFGQSGPRNGPPSGQTATYRKTEDHPAMRSRQKGCLLGVPL